MNQTDTPKNPWHIDALDVRGGLAVATSRAANLLTPDTIFESGPSIFVGPPLFVPELLASRATGFGLARGKGQIGLFVTDEEEVSFDTSDAVAEFVRRVYLRGSSGDGPGESGGAPPSSPPIPPDGDKPPAIEPGELGGEADPIRSMIVFAQGCATTSKRCGKGNALKPQPLSHGPSPHYPQASPSRRLLRGAHRTLLELLRRFGSAEDLELTLSAQRLITVFCRLGITGYFQPPPDHLEQAPEDLDRRPSVEYMYYFLTGKNAWWPTFPGCCGSGAPAADPFDDLALLPVPAYFKLAFKDNLQALLSAALSTPAPILGTGKFGIGDDQSRALAELVLFAACYVVLGNDRSLAIFASNHAAWAIMADRLIERALKWIAANFPQLVFHDETEQLIVSASAVPA